MKLEYYLPSRIKLLCSTFSAMEVDIRGPPLGRCGEVGRRTLPHINWEYYARTPKNTTFKTVWLPVNASNRIVKDSNQDVMYLYYSRHLQLNRSQSQNENRPFRLENDLVLPSRSSSLPPSPRRPPTAPDSVKAAMWMTNVNSLAPFASLGKPTCGYYFSRITDNKKRVTGIPPTNTVKWRSHNPPQA